MCAHWAGAEDEEKENVEDSSAPAPSQPPPLPPPLLAAPCPTLKEVPRLTVYGDEEDVEEEEAFSLVRGGVTVVVTPGWPPPLSAAGEAPCARNALID